MGTIEDGPDQRSMDLVRLVYHYRDGHDFVTETMLRTQALAYMPVLRAVRIDSEHYEAPVAVIELRRA